MTVLSTRHYLQLIQIKVIGNLQAESSRDYLSYLWWIVEPVLQMIAYYFVFGLLLSRGTENYVAFLLTGLIPWLWFNRSVNRSTMSIVSGKALMMQVYIPKIILPTIVVCQDAVKQIVIFIPLLLFLYFYGISPSIHWLAVPVLAFSQLFVIMAFSFFVAAIIPFMHDLRFIVTTGLQLMFFCTGVFFSIDIIPPQFQKWLYLNPMATLLLNYRQVLIHHQWPDWWKLLIITMCSLLAIGIMWRIIKRLDHIYPRVIL
jgi:homopolymeric O-antigen transport system permease protein